MSLIIAAARFAELHHCGIYRKYTGEPYINHPARVAGKVSYHPFSTEEIVVAAWLHDVVEDADANGNKISVNVIAENFGNLVAGLVAELTNPSKDHSNLSRSERKKMDLIHISKISNQSKIIKIIDRMDNLRDYPTNDQQAWDFVRGRYFNESVNLFEVVKDADQLLAHEFAQCLEETAYRFKIGELK